MVGVVLAGGLSRRMGGSEKSRLQLAGKSLLERVLDRIRPQVDILLLNANGDPGRFADYQLPVIADVIPGYAGPLAGVLSGMEWVRDHHPQCRWLVSVAADTPFLPTDLVARLMNETRRAGALLACAASNGRTHPVCGLWPVSLADELRRAMIQDTMRKIGAWVAQYDGIAVEWDSRNGDPFLNINRPQDLAVAEHRLAGYNHRGVFRDG